jgi:hypothetical protein
MKKVTALLNEEQSFEIIDLPQAASSTLTKAKQGHKKVWNKTRVFNTEACSR